MSVQLNSYLSFRDNAREAAEYYKSIFGGELTISTFEEYASPEMPIGDDEKNKVMHAHLKGDNGLQLMLADTPNSMPMRDGARVALSLSGDDETLLRGYWDKLAVGATVTLPFEKAPWGDIFGMLTDKFGIDWMVDVVSLENQDK